MSWPRGSLIGLLLFNGATAVGGAVGLISGSLRPPAAMLEHSFFNSYIGPGFILLTVGLLALGAALAVILRLHYARLLATLSGLAMLAWIIGEIVSIRQFNWLQIVYIITGTCLILIANDKRGEAWTRS